MSESGSEALAATLRNSKTARPHFAQEVVPKLAAAPELLRPEPADAKEAMHFSSIARFQPSCLLVACR